MKPQVVFILGIFMILNAGALLGNNDPVLVTTIKNNKPIEVPMQLEIDGELKLYSVLQEDVDSTDREESVNDFDFMTWILHPDKDFYIGHGNKVEAITPSNFKRIAKKYFAKAPELAKRIGKRGFRYKNLPAMILYYNKSIANKSGLTKADFCKLL